MDQLEQLYLVIIALVAIYIWILICIIGCKNTWKTHHKRNCNIAAIKRQDKEFQERCCVTNSERAKRASFFCLFDGQDSWKTLLLQLFTSTTNERCNEIHVYIFSLQLFMRTTKEGLSD